MKDWNSVLESIGCKYTYEEIKQVLEKFLNTLSSTELKLIREDINELFDKKENNHAEKNN